MDAEQLKKEIDELIEAARPVNMAVAGVLLALRASLHEKNEWGLLEHVQKYAATRLDALTISRN